MCACVCACVCVYVIFSLSVDEDLPYDSANSVLDIYPKEVKLLCRRDICTPIFSIFEVKTNKGVNITDSVATHSLL